MYSLILTSLLSLPVFPLNPTDRDTLNSSNFHITAGVSSPSDFATAGPEFTLKYELLFYHPIVLRTGVEYNRGRVTKISFPNGDYHGFTTSVEILYYRGTDRMMGFMGMGVVYNQSYLNMDGSVADSLLAAENISDVYLRGNAGYRFIFGLRKSRLWSFEIRMTDIRTHLVYRRNLGAYRYSIQREPVRLSDFRITLGYLIEL
ncbi:MAG: hypothetical protein V3S17_00775 [candidate division Zixibacteria bacterium]